MDAQGWRPIETAPIHDGEEILVWDGEYTSIVYRSLGGWTCVSNGEIAYWEDGGRAQRVESPTHWQPLPPPPTREP